MLFTPLQEQLQLLTRILLIVCKKQEIIEYDNHPRLIILKHSPNRYLQHSHSWRDTLWHKCRLHQTPRCLNSKSPTSLWSKTPLMESIGHIYVHKQTERSCLLNLILYSRYISLWNNQIRIQPSIVSTEPNERSSSLTRCNQWRCIRRS